MDRFMLVKIYSLADSVKEVEENNNTARDFFTEDYHQYVKLHGHHFTNKLAEHASSVMHNVDDTSHSWTCEEVSDAMRSLGIALPDKSTIGDMTYTANMAYADFYPLVIKDAPTCVLYSRAVAEDKDGYEGIQFYRWLADLMATNTKLNWKEYV